MKKYSKFLIQIALVLLFVVPLTLHSVNGAWTYYEGKISSVTAPLNKIKLGKFDFGPPKPSDYENDFDDTIPEDIENKDAFEQIMGEKKDDFTYVDSDMGINNPGSAISGALESLGPVDGNNKPVLSSIDMTPLENSGYTNRTSAGLSDDVSFLFVKEEESGSGSIFSTKVRKWHIYTTTTPMLNNDGERVNDYINATPAFNEGDVIPNVYRAEVEWDTTLHKDGSYRIIRSQKGYCRASKISSNSRVPFINSDFTAWKYGSNYGIEIVGPSDNPNHEFAFNSTFQLTLSPESLNVGKVEWSSSNESIATVDNNGFVTVKNDKFVYDSKAIDITATSIDKKYTGSYSFKINLDKENEYRNLQQGYVKNSYGYIVSSTGKSAEIGSSDMLFTSDTMTQGIQLCINYSDYLIYDNNYQVIEAKPLKFTIKTQDSKHKLIVHANPNDVTNYDELIDCKAKKLSFNNDTYEYEYSFKPIDGCSYYMITIQSRNPCKYTING